MLHHHEYRRGSPASHLCCIGRRIRTLVTRNGDFAADNVRLISVTLFNANDNDETQAFIPDRLCVNDSSSQMLLTMKQSLEWCPPHSNQPGSRVGFRSLLMTAKKENQLPCAHFQNFRSFHSLL